MSVPVRIILSPGITVQDVIRALRGSELGVSNSEVSAETFVIAAVPRRWPANVVPLPALLRPQI